MQPDDALCRHFEAVAEHTRTPAIAYGVVADGVLAIAGGVGDGPPDARTPSRICSMTKSFVATAVLVLRDEGDLDLDQPVAAHMPELGSWRYPTLTPRMLLTMSSGLAEDDEWADRSLDWPEERLDALLRAGPTFPTAPGTGFEYANLGWAILGRLVRAVSGVPLQRFVDESILAPLGMTSTTWVPPGDALRGHTLDDDRLVPERAPLGDGAFAPVGGLWSTVADLARWIAFLLDERDHRVLRPASRAEMQAVHIGAPPDEASHPGRVDSVGYGYGLFVELDPTLGRIVGHPGGLPGYGSSMRWRAGRDVGVVALGNRTYAPLDAATLEALDLLDEAYRRSRASTTSPS